ncbi:MAG: DUF421 domain-containing protein [Ruminococcaceae bacterium]|nr:DUF421 domain-containing protein [Oscillospiraceae bacterium]
MIISVLRAVIIYLLIITALRFMGKRQIGELQPTELVVTILISEVASIPLEDTDSPLFAAFIPVIVIICLEVIISAMSLHSVRFRRLFSGRPIIVINDGELDQKALKSLRISVADLLDTLRLKGYFDLQEVKFAIVEMNGQISVMPKESNAPLTPADVHIAAGNKEIPYTVISDGKIINEHFDELGTDAAAIQKQLQINHLQLKDVLLMTADKSGNRHIVKKDKTL